MHRTGTKNIVRHMRKSVVQWSVISKFTCILKTSCAKGIIDLLSMSNPFVSDVHTATHNLTALKITNRNK